METKDIVIRMEDVSWRNGNRYILRGINWIVKRGEHWAIIGSNRGELMRERAKRKLSDFFETPVDIHWRNDRPWLQV
ncbi:MAG: hypothetical protein AB1442_00390 [Nitrospirota bacterium]